MRAIARVESGDVAAPAGGREYQEAQSAGCAVADYVAGGDVCCSGGFDIGAGSGAMGVGIWKWLGGREEEVVPDANQHVIALKRRGWKLVAKSDGEGVLRTRAYLRHLALRAVRGLAEEG